jgi:hypothetical protein
MACFPSFEDTLLEVHKSLGLVAYATTQKTRFADLEMPLENHAEMGQEILESIFKALDMDGPAQKDALGNIMEWANFHKALELSLWTGNASEQQVLWHLLAYSYIPALARRLAFWSLDGDSRQQPMDAGMPGGKFWFIPHWDQKSDQIALPVPNVIHWLFDLLGQPLDEISGDLGTEKYREQGASEVVRRNLENWLDGTLPKSAKFIGDLFPDGATLQFRGVFQLDDALEVEEQFRKALAFVREKKMSSEALWAEIPMTPERLGPVFNGTASDNEKREFVRLLTLRYAQPSMRLIRQRLLVARMTQDGYQRLVKFLCPKVDVTCTDPNKNKVLQLIGLFETIYNMTFESWQRTTNEADEDVCFESLLPELGKTDLFLSILPSARDTAYQELAGRLTRRFCRMAEDSPLEDLIPMRKEDAGEITRRRVEQLKQEFDEDVRLANLLERIRCSSPWRALQAEHGYWVVCQVPGREDLSLKVRQMAVHRMRELAATTGQIVSAILLELGFLLNCDPKARPKDAMQQVERLLDEALASGGVIEWKAPLLRFRAKHRLARNDFTGACADFRLALDACSERSYGGLRGEIARDAFALEVAENGFSPKVGKSQKEYHRNMLAYGMFPDGPASLEDTAAWCENFFWTDLYQPYSGFARKEGPATIQFKAVFEETFGLIEYADWDGLNVWMKRHAAKFKDKSLKNARRNSVLLLWLKMLNTFEGRLPMLRKMTPPEFSGEIRKIEKHMVNWRVAIRMLVEAWPAQAKIADFKAQTPLMLTANNGDTELTCLLAPLSDIDAQDQLGRTALHSAVAGRSAECVAAVLKMSPDVLKASEGEKNTAAHTAVRFGWLEGLRLILDEFPGLAAVENAAGQTPLAMARELLEYHEEWRTYMENQKARQVGTKADFEAVVALLEERQLH